MFSPQGAEPGDPMRIVVLVDNSQIPIVDPLPFIRRGLQEFLNALPPNHELMLVTTGAQMNIRVEPTRDYLTVMQSALSIQVMRNSGNALISSVEEVYARYLRGVERRFPMLVIVATDGPGHESRVTNQSVNALLRQLTNSGVRVNAVMLSPTGYTRRRGIPCGRLYARDDKANWRCVRAGQCCHRASQAEDVRRPHRAAVQTVLAGRDVPARRRFRDPI